MMVAAVANAMFVVAMAVVIVIVVVMVMMFMFVVIIVMVMMVFVFLMIVVMFIVIVVIFIVVVVVHSVEADGPGARFGDLAKVELLRVENFLHIDLAVVRFDHLGGRLQSLHDGLHVFQILLVQAIDLVQKNRVAEFNLLDEEVCNIVFLEVFIEELLAAGEFVGEAHHIHDGDNVVQMAGEALAVTAHQLASGSANGLGYRNRFANTASFDKNVVELAHFQKFGNLFEQIRLERAADAAVRQRNNLARVFLGDVSALFNQGLVDVHFANVIDDDGDMVALLVVENVVEESCFAGSQVTGQERYRYRFHALKFTKKRNFRQCDPDYSFRAHSKLYY